MISKAFMAFGAVLSGFVNDSYGLILRTQLICTRAIDTSYLRNPCTAVSHFNPSAYCVVNAMRNPTKT